MTNSAVPSTREPGFGLVEVIVVLVIIAIVGAAAVHALRGSRDNATRSTAREVARSYFEAAGDYAADNGGVAPVPGTSAWPRADVARGPRNHLDRDTDRRYLRGVPEAISDGRVRLETPAGRQGSASAPTVVRYEVISSTLIQVVASMNGTDFCRLATGPTPSTLPDC